MGPQQVLCSPPLAPTFMLVFYLLLVITKPFIFTCSYEALFGTSTPHYMNIHQQIMPSMEGNRVKCHPEGIFYNPQPSIIVGDDICWEYSSPGNKPP